MLERLRARWRESDAEPLIEIPLTQREAAALIDPANADEVALVAARTLLQEALRASVSDEIDQVVALGAEG